MVIIKGENTPPITWSLGRVSEVIRKRRDHMCGDYTHYTWSNQTNAVKNMYPIEEQSTFKRKP